MKVQLEFKPQEGFGGGFRQEWISAKNENGLKFGMDSGAGFGNPYLTFWCEKDGKREYFNADIRDVITALCEKLADTVASKPVLDAV